MKKENKLTLLTAPKCISYLYLSVVGQVELEKETFVDLYTEALKSYKEYVFNDIELIEGKKVNLCELCDEMYDRCHPDKVIRKGKVAVVISTFGTGWYSSNGHIKMLFDPKIVSIVERGETAKINKEWLKDQLGLTDVYCSNVESLELVWVDVDTNFDVLEYHIEGRGLIEYVVTEEDLKLKA
tara:strand:+ start:617 stop:1165 length:549 start_codon:yes stop_codon:yes gene_type:complete